MRYEAILLAFIVLTGCDNKKPDHVMLANKSHAAIASENYVDTMYLHLGNFQSQIICNGRLRAIVKSELKPRHNDVLTKIMVSNGMRVAGGDVLAITDETLYFREREKAEREMEKARIDLADKLVTMGYDANGDGVPLDVLHRAEVASGYYNARFAFETAERNLEDCKLVAPASGLIADLEGRIHQSVAGKFCSIIDDSQYNVDFSILEAELSSITKGQTVKVSPFVDDSLSVYGNLVNINPTVDENGLIKVQAQIPGGRSSLIDGMNVKVVCQRTIPRMFVVPKDAVVERDGYHVIFLLDNGKARWTYVDVLQTNINDYAITGCKRKGTEIHEGDIVITSGNLNLADDTNVIVK